MSSKPKPIPLSPNWLQVTDPNSGKPYYYHKRTKKTVWTKPVKEIEQDEKENGSAPKKKKVAEDVWLEYKHAESGRVYYYNPKRKETSWHRPDNVISAASDAMVKDTKSSWVERTDMKTGRPYYYNAALGKTSWVNPDAEDSKPKGKPSALKRLSANISQRLSVGVKSSSNLAKDRNSASFSLGAPAIPVNRNSGRLSMRLGEESSEDKFAALRAIQNKKPEHKVGERTDVKDASEALLINLKEEMGKLNLDIIKDKEITDYADAFLLLRRKRGFFGRRRAIPSIELLKHQRKLLKQPLHPLKEKLLVNDAKLAFKLLLWYCHDKAKKKGKTEESLASEFASFGLNTTAEFQNELYMMLIKQSKQNPSEYSLEAVWELIALCCGVFKPDDNLMDYLLSFLKENSQKGDSEKIMNLATYAILKLNRIQERLSPPATQEVAAVCQIAPVELRVNLISAPPLTVQIDSWTTVKDVKEMIEKRFSIQDGTPFALYEIEGESERVLDPNDKMLDVFSYWESSGSGFQALYKMRLYFDINEDDTAAVELAYLQAVYEVLDERYPCKEEDALKLAALEAQEKFGDFNNTDVFEDKLAGYLPPKYYNELEEPRLKAEIFKYYGELVGVDKLQTMINYLALVKQWEYYGSAYFYANPVQLKILGKEFPEQVLIGINAKGVMIIDPDGLGRIADYPYSEIVTWGHSNANFVLVVGNLVRSTKLFFSSNEGTDMNGLIHAYVNKLMEAQTEEEQEELMLNQFK